MPTHKLVARDNTHKLTLVSIRYRWREVSVFVSLPVDKDGRVHADMNLVNRMIRETGRPIVDGATFSMGA